jgi:two-component system CheB/CheR fusion protein
MLATMAPSPDHVAARPSTSRRVLIVDDDGDNVDAFTLYLGSLGHAANGATSGEEALRIWRDVRPDVILLDLGLLGIDGIETCRQLRAAGCRALIAALTGYGGAEDRRQTEAAGFDRHVLKPVNPAAIAALVASAPSLA